MLILISKSYFVVEKMKQGGSVRKKWGGNHCTVACGSVLVQNILIKSLGKGRTSRWIQSKNAILFFCFLRPHATIHNTRTNLSWRREKEGEKKKKPLKKTAYAIKPLLSMKRQATKTPADVSCFTQTNGSYFQPGQAFQSDHLIH